MKKISISLFVIVAIILGPSVNSKSQTSGEQKSDSILFKMLIEKYAKSIDDADTVIARSIWAHTSDVSFIHPRGHEHGWEGVKNIYKMFDTTFSARKLNCFNEKVSVYNEIARVEFYWVFDATFKKGTVPIKTKGRETQVWRKINNEWRIVHVHYSAMPVTSAGQGF